jgi:hypothetical protein
MYHTCAYTLLIGSTADTDVPAVQDDIIQIQNNHFILPQDMRLLAAMAMSPTIARARLVSPTLRQIANPYIRPVQSSAVPGNNPDFYPIAPNPTLLRAFEETQILGTAAPATTERFTTLLWIGDGPTMWPVGNLYPLRWTSSSAAVANAWTTIQIVFQDVIPSGVYTAVMSEHFSANAQAHRWIFSNQVWRPGQISSPSNQNRLPYEMYEGFLGQLGVFRSNDLPRFQCLCNGADAAHEGYMWVMRTGNLA